PESLAIIGGGVVGVEMATAYAALGTRVTVLARHGLLERMEPFAGERVAAPLREAGVDVRTGTSVTAVERDDRGVRLLVDGGGEVAAAEVLVATGRRPRTDDLGLDVVGLVPGEPIAVDDTMRATGHDWLYAVGDANGRALLTHQGKYQARAAGDVIVARTTGARRRPRLGPPRRHRRRARRAAGRLQRPRGRRRGHDRRRGGAQRCAHPGRRPRSGCRRRCLPARRRLRGPGADGRRRRHRCAAGGDVRRPRRGRAAARGDGGGRRSGAARASVA